MLGTGEKCSRAVCGICHVRHTATIQTKRDAATSTLSKREEIQKGVEMQHFAQGRECHGDSPTDSDFVYVYDEWV